MCSKAVSERRKLAGIRRLVLQALKEIHGEGCIYCGTEIAKHGLTIDHFIPLSMGGENSFSNLVLCCRRCNEEKGDRVPRQGGSEWEKWRAQISLRSSILKEGGEKAEICFQAVRALME